MGRRSEVEEGDVNLKEVAELVVVCECVFGGGGRGQVTGSPAWACLRFCMTNVELEEDRRGDKQVVFGGDGWLICSGGGV